MAPEHREMLAAWSARPDVRAELHLRPRDTLLARILRLRPPALARAAIILVGMHVTRGAPLTLPDYVARVYVEDPLALPLLSCDGCGYGMPIRGRILADGRIEYVDPEFGYLGPCPVCEDYEGHRAGPTS